MPILISISPVILFLILINSLDSFKLLKLNIIIYAIIWGIISAIIAYPINTFWFSTFHPNIVYSIAAPITEEILKSLIIIFFFYKSKLGFLADSLIIGFAAGTGFSILENLFYVNQIETQNIMLWIIRGFGTAIMHGSSTAIFAVVSQNIITKKDNTLIHFFLPGLTMGIIIHSLFNSFFLPPLILTILQITLLPLIVIQIFTKSEKTLKAWMESQSDSEIELLKIINEGEFKNSAVGKYLSSIKNRFSTEVMIDILAYIQLHLELSLKAKGILMMKEAGFVPTINEEIKTMLVELDYLYKSIGKTGMSVLKPLIKISKKDLWKINLLK
ncbi:MAG TPA: PrsW family glutamic-type intramembrane protease [Melioribacteraceae bacterium]|nr:PrsW family glutamic-type intramembrane protease [Melioribacteraceae bacterium]